MGGRTGLGRAILGVIATQLRPICAGAASKVAQGWPRVPQLPCPEAQRGLWPCVAALRSSPGIRGWRCTRAAADATGPALLVGAAAALACECDSIGFIGGQEIDLIKKFEAGYIAGAEYINPAISVNSQYLGAAGDNAAWGSPDKAKEIANSWYADGVEVIYSAAGGSGQGTIEAATESDKWAIGVDSDSYLTASEEQQPHILTSMLKRVDVAVFDVYQQFLGDTLASSSEATGGFFVYDLKADGVGYSTSGGFLADYVDQLEEIKAEIIAGTITVPDSVG